MGQIAHVAFFSFLWFAARSVSFLFAVPSGISAFYPVAPLCAAYFFLYGRRSAWLPYAVKLGYLFYLVPNLTEVFESIPQSLITTTGSLCTGVWVRRCCDVHEGTSIPRTVLNSTLILLLVPWAVGALYCLCGVATGEFSQAQLGGAIFDFAVGDAASNLCLFSLFVLLFALGHLAIVPAVQGQPAPIGGTPFALQIAVTARNAIKLVYPYVFAVLGLAFFLRRLPSTEMRNGWYLAIPALLVAVMQGRLPGAIVMAAVASLALVPAIGLGLPDSPGIVWELQTFLICMNVSMLAAGSFASEQARRMSAANQAKRELEVADSAKLRILTGIGDVLLPPLNSIVKQAHETSHPEEIATAARKAVDAVQQLLEYNDLEQSIGEAPEALPFVKEVEEAVERASQLLAGGRRPEIVSTVPPGFRVRVPPKTYQRLLDHLLSVGIRMRRFPASPWRVSLDMQGTRPCVALTLFDLKEGITLEELGNLSAPVRESFERPSLPGGYQLSLLIIRRITALLDGEMHLEPHLMRDGLKLKVVAGLEAMT